MGGEQQSGDIFVSALRGCKRSGDRARLNSGELGSADLVRANPPFLLFAFTAPVCRVGSVLPGLYDCVVFEAPG